MSINNSEEVLVADIAKAFDEYKKDNNISHLKNAVESFNQVSPNNESLKSILIICPEEFLMLLAIYTKDWFLAENTNETVTIEYLIHFWLLHQKIVFGEDKFKRFFSILFTELNKEKLKNKTTLFLKVIYEDQINNRIGINEPLGELIEEHQSWLANNMLADIYFDEENYENAIKCYVKSNAIINPKISAFKTLIEGDALEEDPLFQSVLTDYTSLAHYNALQIIVAYYMLHKSKTCIEMCDAELAKDDSNFLELYKFDIHFYKAFSLHDIKRNKEALDEINKALGIDSSHERSIKFKLYLLERLRKFDEKISYINQLKTIDLNLYTTYSLQLERLQKNKFF